MATRRVNTLSRSGFLFVAVELLLLLLGRRKRFCVENDSMRPALQPGDFLVVDTLAAQRARYAKGDIVVAAHPEIPNQRIVKRVIGFDAGQVLLGSDNVSQGQDSRHFGSVSRQAILGKVTVAV